MEPADDWESEGQLADEWHSSMVRQAREKGISLEQHLSAMVRAPCESDWSWGDDHWRCGAKSIAPMTWDEATDLFNADDTGKKWKSNASNEEQLVIYSLFKQQKDGDCNCSRPGILTPAGQHHPPAVRLQHSHCPDRRSRSLGCLGLPQRCHWSASLFALTVCERFRHVSGASTGGVHQGRQ